uniref:dTDP-glucose 4,6-dehydratase n=1 Tax=Streptomyces rugosporus TaxID=295838 RepID=K7QRJ1_STRRG|nr:PyrC5 [Streptomyces rugosporus]
MTGGAGFIGSHYVRGLLADTTPALAGSEVTVLDKMTYAGTLGNLPVDDPRLTVVRGDVCDAKLLSGLLPGHDAVVHFAAESHVDRSLISGAPFITTNVLGTQTLLEACRTSRVARIVHVSTDEVYGSVPSGSRHEDDLLLPNSPYAASKAASDLVVRAYWRSHGLDVSTTRCSNNYGAYQMVEKAIPLFVTNLLDGLEVPLYGDGTQVREWLHVADHCRAIDLVLLKGDAGEIYNISAGDELSNRDLVGRLLDLCGAGWDRVRHVDDRKAHDQRYSVNTTKIREKLGFEPRISLADGLTEVVNWYRDNRWWWEPLRRRRVDLTS